MENNNKKFIDKTNQGLVIPPRPVMEGKKFSVSKEQLKKDAKDVSAYRLAMSLFATEALAALGVFAYSTTSTATNGFSTLTLTALPSLYFVFDGIKNMVKCYKECSRKQIVTNENIENNEVGMKR